jgi:hypothetical protein
MGWNSWDSYGLSVTEEEYKQNAAWQAQNLKSYGWEYAVVDEGWFLADPGAKQSGPPHVESDGLYWPAANRFPSAAGGAGFRPLADWAHGLGLKFGLHIVRGIPREAVARNLAIPNSQFHAVDAADTNDICPWNGDNYGVKNTPAGHAYYEALAQLYASWNIDFLKVDCISSHPYKGDEIHMISEALQKAGRPMVLSLSPGPTPLEHALDVQREANLWRISDDIWDHWDVDKAIGFSPPVESQFARAAAWSKYAGPGHWPDADMLPIGYLGPRPGTGQARPSRLTHDEEQTVLTGWLIFRSPLILGSNLIAMDDWTRQLLTNSEAIAVNQRATGEHEVLRDQSKVVWASKAEGAAGEYLALFNLGDQPAHFEYPWRRLGLKSPGRARDIWARKDSAAAAGVNITLAPHASALYHVQ